MPGDKVTEVEDVFWRPGFDVNVMPPDWATMVPSDLTRAHFAPRPLGRRAPQARRHPQARRVLPHRRVRQESALP